MHNIPVTQILKTYIVVNLIYSEYAHVGDDDTDV